MQILEHNEKSEKKHKACDNTSHRVLLARTEAKTEKKKKTINPKM